MVQSAPVPGCDDLDALRRAFGRGDAWFYSSPLYQVLARVVAGDDRLLELAALHRDGQQPANMLMAATHMVVLRDPGLPFARFFATVAGDDADVARGAAAEYPAFCADHHEQLAELLRTRLVQTNEPARAGAVRLALHTVAERVPSPVTFLEIGSSAGIQLRFDRWAIDVAGRRFGPADAPLTVRTSWRAAGEPPDLDALPVLRERLGVDLHPVDATDPEERRWLQALVWPEHRDRFVALDIALRTIAADPPELVAGDAIDVLPRLDAERLATDIPLVVFHSQVRMHVPVHRREAFEAAILALGARRRLLYVAMEAVESDPRYDPNIPVLRLRDSAGADRDLALAHGHGRWLAPLPLTAAGLRHADGRARRR
jgi:hypothetical protein